MISCSKCMMASLTNLSGSGEDGRVEERSDARAETSIGRDEYNKEEEPGRSAWKS